MTTQPTMAQRAVNCLLDTDQTLVPDPIAFAVACLIEEHPATTRKAQRALATIVDAFHEATYTPAQE